MWTMRLIVCINVLWFFQWATFLGVGGQSIYLHPYNSSLASTVCQGKALLLGDSFVLTAILNETGTSRDEWPLDRIRLQERWVSDAHSCYGIMTTYRPICEINIERDGCGEPTPGKCGYCDFERDDIYYLVFKVTAREVSSENDTTSRRFELTWPGKSETISSNDISYPWAIGRDFLLHFPVSLDTKKDVYVNGSIANPQYYSEKNASSVCVSAGNEESFRNTWYTPFKTIKEDALCLDEPIYNQLITEIPLESNIGVFHYDYYCSRWKTLTSSLFHGYVKDVECELKTNNFDNSTWSTWVCTPPTYSLCISLSLSFAHFITNEWEWCTLDLVQKINDATFFATYSGKLWKVVEHDTWPTVTITHSFFYDFSPQYTECIKDTGVFSFTLNHAGKDSQSVIGKPGDEVTFFCEIYGFPIPNVKLLGPVMGQLKTYKAMVYLLNVTLDNLQCEDSGRYECKVDRGYGASIAARQKFVDVSVKCPPKVKVSVPDGETPMFTYSPDEGITIEVYGYPEPTQFVLRVKKGDSTFEEVDKELYSVMTVSLTPPFYRLTLHIKDTNEQGVKTYVLHVSSGEGSGLNINFNVGKASSSESPPAWLIIVVTVSCTLIIITVIVLVVIKKTLMRRRSSLYRQRDDHMQSRRNNSDFASSNMSTCNENLNTESVESTGSTPNDHVYSDHTPESDYIDPTPGPDYDNNIDPTPGPDYDNNINPTPGPDYDNNINPTPGPDYDNNINPTPGPDYDNKGIDYTMDEDGYNLPEFM